MTREIYDFCVKNYGFNSPKYEIWNIEDVVPGMGDLEKIKITEETFEEIKKNVNNLVKTYA